LSKLKKNIITYIVITAVIYLGLSLYADFNLVLKTLEKFNWILLPALFSLSLMNYFFRFLKWDYYLNLLDLPLDKLDSFGIFMSGLVMSLTPGKFGEFIKAYFTNQIAGYKMSKTIPIIFAERITDFISLLFLALIGVYIYGYGEVIMLGTSVFFLAIIFVITQKKIALYIIDLLSRIKFLEKHLSKIHDAYESSYKMLLPKPLIKMIFLSLIAWFFECFGFYLILSNFSNQISIFWSTFVYAFSIIVGAITMLPAGVGITEGSLTFMLIEKGLTKDIAVVSTFIIRMVTLWFAILVGIISLMLFQKRYGKKVSINLNQGE